MESSDSKNQPIAASQVLKRALQLDNERKFSEAVTCYEQGIQLLFQTMKGKLIDFGDTTSYLLSCLSICT